MNQPSEPLPKCPWCGTDKHVYESGHAQFWCKKCDRLFDKGEDGVIGYGRPDKYAERREEFEKRQAKRNQNSQSQSQFHRRK